MITAHHQMLSVINRVAGGLIRERIGSTAQKRTAFKQQDPPSRLSQIGGGGEAGEAAPDNQDKGTGGQGDCRFQNSSPCLPVSLSPCPLVPLSPCLPLPLPPRRLRPFAERD